MTVPADTQPAWRSRAIERSVAKARVRAEARAQRFLDAAFELIDEGRSTDFSVHDVVERSQQSMRAFSECFDSRDALVLALLEETVRDAVAAIEIAVARESDPVARVRAFVVTLAEWCDPSEDRRLGEHRRRPIAELSVQLAPQHGDRVRAALVPQTRMLRGLIAAGAEAGAFRVDDVRVAAALVQQMVFHSWFGNRLTEQPKIDTEALWRFCLAGLGWTYDR